MSCPRSALETATKPNRKSPTDAEENFPIGKSGPTSKMNAPAAASLRPYSPRGHSQESSCCGALNKPVRWHLTILGLPPRRARRQAWFGLAHRGRRMRSHPCAERGSLPAWRERAAGGVRHRPGRLKPCRQSACLPHVLRFCRSGFNRDQHDDENAGCGCGRGRSPSHKRPGNSAAPVEPLWERLSVATNAAASLPASGVVAAESAPTVRPARCPRACDAALRRGQDHQPSVAPSAVRDGR